MSPSATPSSSAITRTGTGVATSATKSISSSRGAASSTDATILRTRSSIGDTARGVNSRLTICRYVACSGGSMCRIEPSMGLASGDRPGSFTSTPRADEKRDGSRLMARMSSYRDTSQVAGADRNTGASRRSRASVS